MNPYLVLFARLFFFSGTETSAVLLFYFQSCLQFCVRAFVFIWQKRWRECFHYYSHFIIICLIFVLLRFACLWHPRNGINFKMGRTLFVAKYPKKLFLISVCGLFIVGIRVNWISWSQNIFYFFFLNYWNTFDDRDGLFGIYDLYIYISTLNELF